jgi:hypothetical protein
MPTSVISNLFCTAIFQISSCIAGHAAVHTTSELATTASGVIVFLAFLRVPLTPSLGLELPLSVLFTFLIHHAAVREFLAAFLCRFLLALHE